MIRRERGLISRPLRTIRSLDALGATRLLLGPIVRRHAGSRIEAHGGDLAMRDVSLAAARERPACRTEELTATMPPPEGRLAQLVRALP